MSLISRRSFLKSGAVATTMSTLKTVGLGSTHSRKNVLFIAVDDQNVSLGCYGATQIKSPHLDDLAKRGVRFSRAYCQYPLCGPSRASLMTGCSPDTTKIYDLQTRVRDTMPNAVTLGQLFRKDGYFSARVGKIYHEDVPADIGHDGLDDPATWDYVYNPVGEDRLKDEPLVTNFTPGQTRHDASGYARLGSTISFYASPSSDDVMTDSKGADEVIRLLRANKKRPFFIAFGLYRPHVPWIVPQKYFDQYPVDQIKPRPFDPAELKQAPAPAYTTQPANFGMSEMQCRQAIQAYSASTSFMDVQVGRVLGELKSLGLDKNTIVVFWADHGWSLGEHGQWEKLTLFETATHVPLIFAGPGINAGQVCQRTVEHLDIYPTLAELCGLSGTPSSLQGTSLVRLLKQSDATWDKPAITEVTRPPTREPKVFGYSIRTERYRYTSWQGDTAGEELYDYETDPGETKNLAAMAEMQPLKANLRSQLDVITLARGRSIPLGKVISRSAGTSRIQQQSSAES